MAKPCPRCRLIHPDSAVRCECGHDFATGRTLAPSFRHKRPAWREELPAVIAGLILFPPMGLRWLWLHPTLSQIWKVRITAIWAVLWVVSLWLWAHAVWIPRLQP